MKTMLLAIMLLASVTFSTDYTYEGVFLGTAPTGGINYNLVLTDDQGVYRWGNLHLGYPGHMAMFNLANLMETHINIGGANRIRIKIDGDATLLELTVWGMSGKSEFEQIEYLDDFTLGKLFFGGDGALVVKMMENGLFRYHVGGSSMWTWHIYGGHNQYSSGYKAMKKLFEGNKGLHNETTLFQIHVRIMYYLATPIPNQW